MLLTIRPVVSTNCFGNGNSIVFVLRKEIPDCREDTELVRDPVVCNLLNVPFEKSS